MLLKVFKNFIFRFMVWRKTPTIHIYIIEELNLQVFRQTIKSKIKINNILHTMYGGKVLKSIFYKTFYYGWDG
jgi:hypothetical protein